MVESLNSELDVAVRANSFYNPINPKAGIMAIGNNGIEFRSNDGDGYIQMPWKNIELVRAQVFFGGRYIRGFDIITDEQLTLPFVVSDAKEALRIMRRYLRNDQMVKAPSNFKKLFKRKNKKTN